MMAVCTYHSRGMSSISFGSQHGTKVDRMGEYEVTEYYIV